MSTKRKRGRNSSPAESDVGRGRPNKRRRKSKSISASPSVANSSSSSLLPQRGKKQICPKAAFQLLPEQQDQLLFFDLLSKTKRPSTDFEWDLMAQAFIHHGSNKINGKTLYNFYKVLCENGSIYDPQFVDSTKSSNDDDNDNDECDHINNHNDIDFSSKLYRTAYSKFMNKLNEFNKTENVENVLTNDHEIKIEDKCIDLFYLYILVTKHGGFDRIKSWINILHQMSCNFNPHSKYFIINELKIIYNKYLYKYEQMFFQSDLISDDFDIDLYLEDAIEIIDILRKCPSKFNSSSETENDSDDTDNTDKEDNADNVETENDVYWLDMMPNGNNLQSFMFGNAIQTKHNLSYHRLEKSIICASGVDKKELINRLTIDPSSNDIKEEEKNEDENEDDDVDDKHSVESVIKSMVYHRENIVQIADDENIVAKQYEFINKHLCICFMKGMHPYTRRLITNILKECASNFSINQMDKIMVLSEEVQKATTNNPRKSIHKSHQSMINTPSKKSKHKNKNKSLKGKLGKEMYKLTEYEINFIIDELIIKMLRLNCCKNNFETTMIMAFENGLNLLKSQYENNSNGYSLYRDINNNCIYYVYYKRIMAPFEKFVVRAIKQHLHFLAHPKGLSVLMISSNHIIKKGTFLTQIYGELYSSPRWIEHTFSVKSLHHKLQSGYPLFRNRPCIIEYLDIDKKDYNLLSILNYNNIQITQSGQTVNNGGYKHWITKLNHSCHPNCCIKPFIHKNKIRMGLFAIRDIKKGDELTIKYEWFSQDINTCKESICLCGLSICKGTFIRYKDTAIENGYLFKNHSYLERMVNLLNATLKPLNEKEKQELKKLYIKRSSEFGDWIFKYFAFLSRFIQKEHKYLPQQLMEKSNENQNGEYTLVDAQNDANHILIRRMRSLSITMERVKWYLKKQQTLFKQQITNNQNNCALNINGQRFIPKYVKLFSRDNNTLFVPPIRFAEIDEIIYRLWNDEDSLINRLLKVLSTAISSDLYNMIAPIVHKCGLIEESQNGLYTIRCKFVEIAKILKHIKCNKVNRHHAAADILYLYANTYRFFKCENYLSFASSYCDFGLISSFRGAVKTDDNRYQTRSVRSNNNNNHNSDTNDDNIDDEYGSDNSNGNNNHCTAKQRFIYSSSFPFQCLLGWYHHCSTNDHSSINGEIINKYLYHEYFDNAFGTILLPDIESCYDPDCKGLYMNTHRKCLFNCILEKKNWMNQNYTKQYENDQNKGEISSCPVPQFTFNNKTGLFGSPVFDTYFAGFDNSNNKYLKSIVNGLQNDYCMDSPKPDTTKRKKSKR